MYIGIYLHWVLLHTLSYKKEYLFRKKPKYNFGKSLKIHLIVETFSQDFCKLWFIQIWHKTIILLELNFRKETDKMFLTVHVTLCICIRTISSQSLLGCGPKVYVQNQSEPSSGIFHRYHLTRGSTLTSQDYNPSSVVYVPEQIRAI